jgi:predicted lipid carrier protein YhbT
MPAPSEVFGAAAAPSAPSRAARPAFVLPPFVRAVISRLPAFPASVAGALTLSLVAPRVVGRDALATLEGSTFRIVVRDAGASVAFRIAPERFVPLRPDHVVDVTFTANAADFLRLATRRADPDTLFFDRRLLIEGDTETGLQLKNMLDAVELPHWLAGVCEKQGRTTF